MFLRILLFSVTIFLVIRVLLHHFRRSVISSLPGPTNTSYLAGHFKELLRSEEITDAPLDWSANYGTAFKLHGEMGMKMLCISDPKAIQYVLNTSGYNFPKPLNDRILLTIILGSGILSVEGAHHARQRKILNPAFSSSTLKEFLPIFRQKSTKLVNKLKEEVDRTTAGSNVVDLVPWLSRITLDIIGAASADYDFEALDGVENNKLAQAYNNLLNCMKIAAEVAQEVVDKQTQLYLQGKEGSKDLMSLLAKKTRKHLVTNTSIVHANLSEDPKTKLPMSEVLAQFTYELHLPISAGSNTKFRTFFLAGRETTGSAVVWTLYELSKHFEWQRKVREEIAKTRSQASERGDSELTVADLDSMSQLRAVMKETLRLYPINSFLTRQAGKDDCIPLSYPVPNANGKMLSEIPINRGERVLVSFIAYNRIIWSLKSVWGEDADEWRPERFLEGNGNTTQSQVNLGLVANLATFSSGVRGCIGWRFALLEMQAILIELLENFEFSPPPGNVEIIRGSTGTMAPMVKGSTSGRTQLPITLTSL
ncbi:hypothetical protein Clacol_005854 [Clathrus columnatus]|uniref:Cytochrome P450 n=1 Tax=Clathrus columnatus TaxID=1419009 RepID=A0AAV5AEQ8_9AGAM|nr:hypothetical protein Clacol_005854 [Clathrus columnatus]